MVEILRVIKDMRQEMGDMQAELLALRGQQRARQPGPDARIPDHQDASGDADMYGYCKNHKKMVKTGQTRTQEWKECTRARSLIAKRSKVNPWPVKIGFKATFRFNLVLLVVDLNLPS
ncbi:hypothetical protein Tco_1204429 [Tanacetum coccineum]